MESGGSDADRFARNPESAVSVLMLLLGLATFAAMFGLIYACDRF